MAKKNWYAWRDDDGNSGVHKTWPECQRASSSRRGEKHGGFQTYEEAWAFAYPGKPVQYPEEEAATEEPAKNFPPEPMQTMTAEAPEQPEMRPLPALDMSRAEKGPVSEHTHEFCRQYGFDYLSEDQRRAVQSVRGKYLLFAVPGSGKTTVIMARTGYLIHGCGIDPEELMTMTFTKASAKEMRDRYSKYFGKAAEESNGGRIPDFRTIHSFCYSIVIPLLRSKGFRCPNHVINEDLKDKTKAKKKYLQRMILRNVLRHFMSQDQCSDETIQDAFQTAFSSIKNRDLKEEVYRGYSIKVRKNSYNLAAAFDYYQQTLQELDCMDFDDMLVYALRGLRENPKVLAKLQGRYKYWSVDEAQDNSKIQQELVQLLAGSGGNLFMVGDDDQSIYSFRGAEPNLLLEYGRQPDVHLLVMGTNFRSDADIVAASKRFVEVNEQRADKQMNASHKERGKIGVLPGFGTEAQQYDYIDQAAKECQKTGKHLGVLYQLNASALPLIVHMHRAGIPFEASKGLADLLRGKIAGNILQILRFALNPNNMERFLECRRSLGIYWVEGETADQLKNAHERNRHKGVLQTLLECQEKEDNRTEKLQQRISDLKEVSALPPSEAVWKAGQAFLKLSFETLPERLAFYSFLSICDLYPTTEEMLKDLDGMMKAEKQKDPDPDDEEPAEEETEVKTEGKPVVTLSTIHSAKGREWDHVILIDSFEESFPGKPQWERIGYDPEEPRRLFYVAATRAIHQLDMLTVEYWHGNIEQVSSFVPNYAWIADQITETPVSESTAPELPEAVSSEHELSPTVYYGVPVGRKPGVYTSYGDAQEQVCGFSVPPDKQLKKFPSYKEAWAYAFPDIPITEESSGLVRDSVQSAIQMSGGSVFNKPMDLSGEVREGLLAHLGVPSLKALPGSRIEQMKKQSELFGKGIQAVYHGHTDGYSVVYLPVNYYKIWLPLWLLLEKNRLPVDANILELGPGPGTSTWSLVSLYKQMAADNPQVRFALRYTAVELEPDFSKVFNSIRIRVEKSLPPNLSMELELLSGRNAFEYINGRNEKNIDLLIESNLLNEDENRSDETVNSFFSGLRGNLKAGGHAIMIEPGTGRQLTFMEKLSREAKAEACCTPYLAADKASVFLGGNTLVQDAVDIGLRYSRKMEHWFTYLILEKAVE